MTNDFTLQPWKHGEFEDPLNLAERVLNRPFADPDDDLAVLARQLKRRAEWAQRWHELVEAIATSLEVNSALGLEELAREIPAAIQRLRDSGHEPSANVVPCAGYLQFAGQVFRCNQPMNHQGACTFGERTKP